MALDTSIALQARPIQLDNPLDVQTKALTLRQLGLQTQQAEQAQREQQTLADLYRSNVGTDGNVNHQAVIQGLATAGLGNRIPAYQKQLTDAQKSQADLGHVNAQTDELKIKATKQRLDASGAAISSLLSRPGVTHDDVIMTISNLVQQGVIDPTQGAQMARGLPGDPVQLRSYLMQKGLEVMDASKRMDLLTPKFDKIDNGGAIQMGTIDQLTGQFTPGQAVRKVQTPDSVASVAATMRGQNMTDARAREAATQAQFIPIDGVGLYVGDKRTGVAKPVVDPSGKPVVPNKALTEGQAKANLFGTRMQEADKIINTLAAQGVTAPSLPQQIAGGNGLAGSAATAMAKPEQQQVDQAQRDFINAVLRRESGAAISPGEFDSARKQYFVQPGDSPQVINQKARNRALATQGMLAEVPEEKRGASNLPAAPGTLSVPETALPPDIAAILKKHGAK